MGFLGIGFEFLGIAGLFTALGIYLDGKWGGGRGLILIASLSIGVAAGIWHLIRRVRTLDTEMKQARLKKPSPTPEENLEAMDRLGEKLSDLDRSKSGKGGSKQ